jgi:hypothetical protein
MIIDPFDDFGAVTSCNRVAHVNQDELDPLARVERLRRPSNLATS